MTLPSHLVTFDAKPAEDVVRRIKGALTLSAAGKYLNAPRVHIHLLAKGRFIEPCVSVKAYAANNRYALEDLDGFLQRLLQGAHTVRKPKAGQVNIPAAAKRACRPAVEILRLNLDHKLSWLGKVAKQNVYTVGSNIDRIKLTRTGVSVYQGGVYAGQQHSVFKTIYLVALGKSAAR